MRAPLAAVFLLAATTPGLEAGCGSAADAAAVEGFVASLLARDAGALAAVLPHEGVLQFTTTIVEPPLSDVVPAERVAAELANGVGVHALLLDGGPDDDFADWIDGADAATWVEEEPDLFEPEGGDGRAFLRLRCEDGRSVIAEVGWPAA